ncbi:MAG: DUF4235 domain-containing protein [Gemmatimonadota bacterium]|nr:DUF4235 domain-containing protein [Gemmatimonadota bacterium]
MTNLVWKAFAALAATSAAAGARRVVRSGWKRAKDEEPPENPAASSVTWKDALAWGLLIGVAGGVARIVSRRGAAYLWESGFDEDPTE